MNQNPEMQSCRNSEAPIHEDASLCASCGVRKKNLLFFSTFSVVLFIALVALGCQAFTDDKEMERKEVQNRSEEIVLSGVLPEMNFSNHELIGNNENFLTISVKQASESDYRGYLEACLAKGFDIESKEQGTFYSAYGREGHELTLSYIEGDRVLMIYLSAPTKMEALVWPANDLVKRLPVPKSNVGKIFLDLPENFMVDVGNTSMDEYEAYVDECVKNGFAVDSQRSDRSYEARDAEGYDLSLSYVGNQLMYVQITPPKDTVRAAQSEPSAPLSDRPERDAPSANLRPEFKAAMDEFEAFYDEFAEVTEEYENNPHDSTITSEYDAFFDHSNEIDEMFINWGEQDLSAEEESYYIEVGERVFEKIFEWAKKKPFEKIEMRQESEQSTQ